MWAAIQRRRRSQSSAAEASKHPFRVGGLVLGSDARERTQFPVSHRTGRPNMSVYDVVELIGSSSESWEKAAANAVEQASKSLRDLRIAEITELDMQLDAKGKVEAYRAKVKLSFKYEGS
jgi:dodecin